MPRDVLGVVLLHGGFLANFLVPKSVDAGVEGTFGLALAANLGLLALFGVPHSVMARPAFKRWWTKFVPEPIERSTYVLVSNLFMILLAVAVATDGWCVMWRRRVFGRCSTALWGAVWPVGWMLIFRR